MITSSDPPQSTLVFADVKAILDFLVRQRSDFLKDVHGPSFSWETREQLLAASVVVFSGTYRLIAPELIQAARGHETNLVRALRDPTGVDENGRMPFRGDIEGNYATSEQINTIVAWIDAGCP